MNGLNSLQREVSGSGSSRNKRRASDTDLRASNGSSAAKKRRVASAEKSTSLTGKSILSYFSPLSKSSSNLSSQSDDGPLLLTVEKKLDFQRVIVIDSDEEATIDDAERAAKRSTAMSSREKRQDDTVDGADQPVIATVLNDNNTNNNAPNGVELTADIEDDTLLQSEDQLEQTQELDYEDSALFDAPVRTSSASDSAGQLNASSDTVVSDGTRKSLPSYYLRNFFLIVDTVLDKDKHLFNEREWELIDALKTSPEHTQRLYIRLFYRKGPWFQESKLETTYREIPDIVSPRNEMQSRGLALSVDSTSKSVTESDVIDLASMLTTAQLTQLMKSHAAGQQKVKRKDELLAALESSLKVKSQSTLFNYLTSPTASRVDHWLRQIVALTGPCLRLTDESKHVFQRAHRLFFLNRSEDATTVFLVNFGKVKYPIYITAHEESNTNQPKESRTDSTDVPEATSSPVAAQSHHSTLIANQFVNWKTYKPCSVFASRDHLLKYETALDLAQQMTAQMGKDTGESLEMSSLSFGDGPGTKQHAKNGKYDDETVKHVKALINIAVESLQSEVSSFSQHEIEVIDLDDTSRASSRTASPVKTKRETKTSLTSETSVTQDLGPTLFLRRFTAGWIHAAMVHVGVSLHERLRDYQTAIKYLELLLALPYVPHKRGHWWNRLALNLEHVNKKAPAFTTCQKGLNDKALSRACRLTLEQRLVRLGKNKHNWSGPPADSVVLSLKPPRSVLVHGSTRPGGVSGRKSAFVGYNGAPCGVEDLALQFYKLKGGWRGMHSEGEVFRALFTLLFWDIIYSADIPFVFQTPYQDAPLDLTTEAFYYNRCDLIEERLALIEHGTSGEGDAAPDHALYSSPVKDVLTHTWNTYNGTMCRGLNWKHWELADLVTIAHCVGGPVLCAVFNRFARDYSRTGSGLPDLILWATNPARAKFVEVKGPRDKLSDKQKVWLDVLARAGADVEVFKVKEKLKPGEVSEDLDLVFDQASDEASSHSAQDPSHTADAVDALE